MKKMSQKQLTASEYDTSNIDTEETSSVSEQVEDNVRSAKGKQMLCCQRKITCDKYFTFALV